MESIIDKIRKLMALSEDKDDDEAQAAILLAQRLIAKYNIEQDVVERDTSHRVTLYEADLDYAFNWYRLKLLSVICNNFKTYCSVNHYGPRLRRLSIVGERVDVELAQNVFMYALAALEKCAKAFTELPDVKRKWKRKKEMKEQYISGFIVGLHVKLETQKRASEEMALALTIHPAITEQVKDRFDENSDRYGPEIKRNTGSFVSGFIDGQQFNEKIAIE